MPLRESGTAGRKLLIYRHFNLKQTLKTITNII